MAPPPLPLQSTAPSAAAPVAPEAPAPAKQGKRGRRGRRSPVPTAAQPQAVDPALLAAYQAYSAEVQPSEAPGVYFPALPAAEVAPIEVPKTRRRETDDLTPRGRGRAPATGKAPFVLAGVGALGLGTAFAVAMAGHHGTAAGPALASDAVHVDATSATKALSITVPPSATKGAAYTLRVPAGFVADAGSDARSDVLLSEPVLDLHLRVQSWAKDPAPVPPGTPAAVTIDGHAAKGTQSVVKGQAVRTVQLVHSGVTYTVTETVPAEGQAHTFKVLDQVLSDWTFRG
jgi:hypothetical protein